MTVTATPRKAPFNGNGSATVFPWTFKTQLATDITVIRTTAAGSVTTLTKDSDYTVSLNANQDTSPGGSITYPISGSPLPTGDRLDLLGSIAYTQDLVIPSAGAFSSVAMNNQLDRIVMQIQQLKALIDGALIPPNGETLGPVPVAAVRALKLLGFDASGNPIAVAASAQSATALSTDLADTSNAGKGAGQVGFNSALTYGSTTVGYAVKQITLDLADTVSPSKNAGLIGFNSSLSYPAGTLGKALNDQLPIITAAARPSLRNKVINGAFDVWQRATSFSTGLATYTYTADRWLAYATGAAATVSRNAGNGYTGGTDALLLTGAASNTYVDIRQRFEAREVAKFKNGSVTVSARLYNNTGSTIAANSVVFTVTCPTATDNWTGSTQRLGTTFTHAAIPNASWGYLTVTFTPTAYGDIDKGMDIGLRVTALLAGQAVNWSEVQLETGAVAQSFEHRTLGFELALCQRYYWTIKVATSASTGSGYVVVDSNARFYFQHPVVMRAAPSLTHSGTAGDYGVANLATLTNATSVPSIYSSDASATTIALTTGATLTPGQACSVGTGTGLAFFGFNAEL